MARKWQLLWNIKNSMNVVHFYQQSGATLPNAGQHYLKSHKKPQNSGISLKYKELYWNLIEVKGKKCKSVPL